MQYERLIREAWRMAWGNRYLWILGLFAGGSTGVSMSGSPGEWQMDRADLPRELNLDQLEWQLVLDEAMAWIVSNIAIIALAVGVLVLIGMAFTLFSIACQAGMAVGTLRLAQGSASSLGAAWRGGTQYFGRFLGLWLLLAGFGLLVALAVAAVVALMVASSMGTGSAWTGIALGLVLGAPFALVALVLSVVLSIVVPLAQRAMVDQDLGPIAALRAAWELARRRVVSSLLIWLLAVVLGIVAAIAAGLVIVVIAIAAAIILVPLWFMAEASAPFFIALGIAMFIMVLTLVVMAGLANALFWSYWTLSYLQLRGAGQLAAED